MLDMETTKIFLTLSIFVLMTFSLLVSIRYGKVNKWTYIMIPFILILSMTVKTSIEDMLGYPTNKVISKQQLYVTHMVGINKEWIYIWAIDRDISWEPRSYKIVYTKEDQQKLEEAKQQQQAGVPVGIMMEAPMLGGGTDHDTYSLQVEVYDKFLGHTKENTETNNNGADE
jgi:hypothetical protein